MNDYYKTDSVDVNTLTMTDENDLLVFHESRFNPLNILNRMKERRRKRNELTLKEEITTYNLSTFHGLSRAECEFLYSESSDVIRNRVYDDLGLLIFNIILSII